jgi:hypothetical protein
VKIPRSMWWLQLISMTGTFLALVMTPFHHPWNFVLACLMAILALSFAAALWLGTRRAGARREDARPAGR